MLALVLALSPASPPDPPSVAVRDDAPPSVAVRPAEAARPTRVRVAGYWWDRRPDGKLVWCTECNGPYPAAGVPGMTVVDWNGHRPAAPGVAAPQPFRGPARHAGHDCPVCGRSQYVISGPGPVPGSHTHTCAAGHSWWH